MVASLTIGRRAFFFVIRWVNDSFVSEFAVITAILVIMGIMALITYMIGVHTVLGAFVAGILVGESPILTRHIDEQLRGLITAFFAPVFFGIAGLSADLTILADPEIALFTAGLVMVASLGKFGGAFLGAELGGLTRREGFALACGMNARGSTEVIIATVGLSMGALNQNLFTMIVAMAMLTTMAMPPTLRWALNRIPMRKEEKQRLEREELEQRGFVPNLERLLVAVDDSPNGKFALRTTGVLAGTHGMSATVLHVPEPSKIESTMPDSPAKMAAGAARPPEKIPEQKRSDGSHDGKKNGKDGERTEKEQKKAEDAGDAVQQVAAQIKNEQKNAEKSTDPVDVTTLVHEQPSPAIIAEEAKKGYDVFIIGLGQTSKQSHEFDPGVTNLAKGFDGPLIVSAMRADLQERPDGKLSILVPVNGTEPSRRGAEVAITLARAAKAQVTVLYVAVRPANRAIRGSRRHEEAILKDIVAIADGYNISIRTAVVAERAADEAILAELKRRNHNLVVLGVGRRPGERLFFGDTAAALLEKSERSLLFVAS